MDANTYDDTEEYIKQFDELANKWGKYNGQTIWNGGGREIRR